MVAVRRARRGARALVPLVAAATLLLAGPAGAQEPVDSTRTHVVRPGDTLWDLARRYLSDPFRWKQLFGLNQDVVADPDRIYPGERLRLPLPADPAAAPDAVAVAPQPAAQARTVFFTPEAEPAREITIRTAEREEVPVVNRGDFLRAGLLVPDARIQPVGHLVEVVAPSVVPVEIPGVVHPYGRVYLRMAAPGSVTVGDRLHLMRPGREIRPYGRVFESTGLATVARVDGEVATLVVEEHFDAVEVGNIAVPLPPFAVPAGAQPTPTRGPEGHLVAFEEPHSLHALHDLAFVDIGRQAGLVEGDELEVVLPPEPRRWGVRPEVLVARLRVIRVAEHTAAASVTRLEHPALEPGLRVRRVGKMP